MKDHIRRSAKFLGYIIVIFVVILGVIPYFMDGKSFGDTYEELMANSRFTLVFGLLIAYSMFYPLAAFTRKERHLNGSFAQNRDKFDKVFAALNYIKTLETEDRIVYRKKSILSRILQFNEDAITVFTKENPVIVTGFRKWVIRIDRMIDQYITREA
jgi:hypothetical protein